MDPIPLASFGLLDTLLTDSGKSRGILFIALAGAVLFGTVVGVLTKLTLYSKPTVIGTLSIEKTWEIFSQNQSFTWRFVAYSFASFLLLSIAIFFGLRVARTIGMSTQWGIKFDTDLIILAAGSAFYGCICALFAKKL